MRKYPLKNLFHCTGGFRNSRILPTSTRLFLSLVPSAGSSNNKPSNKKPKGNSKDEPASTQTIEEIRQVRLQKIDMLKSRGINPFAYTYEVKTSAEKLQDEFSKLENGVEDSTSTISIAGRIMNKRVFGKLAFFTLQDSTGTIQLYIDKSRLNDAFDLMRDSVDIGDIIGVQGTLKRTEKGELSIYVGSWEMLTKSLLPLPDKYHGLTDVNKRYRQRHLDMIVNQSVRKTFQIRASILRQIRSYLDELNYIEMETPILQSQPGGAEAKPFETFHHSLNMEMTLRIATELHLKRLIVGGFDRVYEMGRIFRNEGLSPRHNPEFTSIELYQAYAD
jgi:lysyl-tRNA synthetase, class II